MRSIFLAKVIFEDDKYKITYDLKALLAAGICFSINGRAFVAMFFGWTFIKKK